MANTTPPELIQAFKLIKAGQKPEAGRILKAYLKQDKHNVQAWYLMAHAVNQPEVAQRCLETVLKLDPDHEKARELLAKLAGESAPTAPPPAEPSAPADDPFAPTPVRAAPVDDPFAPPPAEPSAPADDPFAPTPVQAAPVDDPFAPTPVQAAPVDDPFAPTPVQTAPVDDPFAPTPADDPFAPTPVQAAPVDDPFVTDDSDGYDTFPDDDMVLASLIAAAAPPPTSEPAPKPAAPASFEDFLTTDEDNDPFAGPPVDDPFAEPDTNDDPFAAGSGSYDPFAAQNVFDPTAAAHLGQQQTTQEAGSGNQPEWGPGLGFIQDTSAPPEPDLYDGSEVTGASPDGAPGKSHPILTEDDLRVRRRRRGGSNLSLFLIIGGVTALVVLVLLIYGADQAGFINLTGEKVPDMSAMDGGSFSISYPENYDQRCSTDPYGYPVCGAANHSLYNEVDFFAGTNIDLTSMLADMFNLSLGGGDLPDEQFSIIAMDVPVTSPSYDDRSWAKTLHEWTQQGWFWDAGAENNYVKKEIEVDGYTAYYYEYTSEGQSKQAAWDVYIPHDGIIFWFRVDYWGERKHDIPHKTVAKMIDSIDIK